MVSFGSVLSGMIAVVLLSIYGFYFISNIKYPIYRDLRFLIFLLLVAGLRMLVPVNLPINITIPNKGLLFHLASIVYTEVGKNHLFLYQIIFAVSLTISIILLTIKSIRYLNYKRRIFQICHEDERINKLAKSTMLSTEKKVNITILCADAQVSPFVFGVFHPVIVIPAHVYTDEELKQVLEHELTHIRQHDLYIKAAFNILTAIFWWNPFIWMIRRKTDEAIEISNDLSLLRKMTEEESTDYASLIVKTTALQLYHGKDYSLSLATHGDPLIKRRVENLLNSSSGRQTFTAVHVVVLILILAVSFIVTPEPYGIPDDELEGSYDYQEDFNASAENSYIIDKGTVYELYINGELMGEIDEIPDEFKDYPVYKEKPGEGE